MTDPYENQVRFTSNELTVGRVVGVHTFTDNANGYTPDPRPTVDVVALNGNGAWIAVPVLLPPGLARNMRYGQTVVLGFLNGQTNFPTVIGHLYNLENVGAYADPVPTAFANLDDYVIYHAETNSHIRFRTVGSTPGTSPAHLDTVTGKPVIQPAIVDLTLNSGATLTFTESAGGLCTFNLTMPSGASVVIDTTGNVTTTAPATADIKMITGLTSITLDPVADKVTIQSGDPIQTIIDGANQKVTHICTLDTGDVISSVIDGKNSLVSHAVALANGNAFLTKIDGVASQVRHTLQTATQTVETHMDAALGRIHHTAAGIGLGVPGTTFDNLPADAAGLTQNHLSTFESSLLTKRLNDLSLLCNAMVAAAVPNAGAVYGLIASLAHVPIPNGSPSVKIQSS